MLLKNIINHYLVAVGVFCLYIFSHLLYGDIDLTYNTIVFILAYIGFVIGVIGFGKNKYDLAPVFNIAFYFTLLVSCFSFSSLQESYDFNFLVLMVVGGGGFSLTLALIDKIPIPKVKFRIGLNSQNVTVLLTCIYISLKLIIIYKTGFRLDALIDGNKIDGNEFVIPGVSGLAATLQWVLLIMFPFINNA